MTEDFGTRLRRLRHVAGLTLEELAEASGISVRAISNLERGDSRTPQRGTVERLADGLGLTDGPRAELIELARAGRRSPAPPPAPGLLAMPRGVTDFAGRRPESAVLRDLPPGDGTGPAAVAVISGQPGIGKTSLAVHTATALAAGGHDGAFFVDLRGLDPRPLQPAVALERLVRALAPQGPAMPADPAERAALYRTLVARRRVVVVLDNAADENQVRPLLPATGPSLTLVTSRRRLSGLEGVRRLPLEPLADADARGLIANAVEGRPDADEATVAELARLCANLPLALRIVANRLDSRPDWSPARLATRLGDEERRLAGLTAGDLEVGAAFALSYAQLSEGGRRLFRRLALVPGPDTGPAMSAALTGDDVSDTEDALDELVELGLVQSGFSGRYRLHDLIRLFARERLDAEETAAERETAGRRMVDWVLGVAVVAGRWFEPGYARLPDDWDGRVPLETREQAHRWLETEAANWLAALETAAAEGRWRLVVEVAEAMHWFSDRWVDWGHWPRVFSLGSTAALELGDHLAAATQLNYLSWAHEACLREHATAAEIARRAHAEAVAAGDVRQQGWSRSYLAVALLAAGRPAEALGPAVEAVRLLRSVPDLEGLPHAMTCHGRALERTGRVDEALASFRHRLEVISDPATAPGAPIAGLLRLSARIDIARVMSNRGDWAAAVEALRPGRELDPGGTIPQWQAAMHAILGEGLCRLGDLDTGRRDLAEAVAIYERLGDGARAAEVRSVRERFDGVRR